MASSPRIDELKRKFDENPRRYFAPLANEYRKAGDVAEAIKICRAHLPQQPGHMSGHIVFGQALFEAGELDESRQVFEAALQLDPENLIALRHLGDIARSRGDLGSARHWYERVLDADPRNEEIAGQLASLDAEEGTETAAAPSDGGMGWGDINPEQPAAEASTGGITASLQAHALFADDETPSDAERGSSGAAGLELRESVAMPATEARFPELGDVPPAPAAREASPPARAGDEADLDFGDLTAPEPATPTPAPDRAQGREPAVSASAANDFGFEVMEFQPPPREQHAPVAGLEAGEFAAPGGGADATPAAFVTETMAELYLQQGFKDEALAVYRQLLAQNPHDEGLRDRISQLEHGARASISIAEVSDEVMDHAQRRLAMPTPRSVRAFFGGLAARRAPRTGEMDAWREDTRPAASSAPAPAWEAAPTAPPDEPTMDRPADPGDADVGVASAEFEGFGDGGRRSETPDAFAGYAPSGTTPAQALPFIDTGDAPEPPAIAASEAAEAPSSPDEYDVSAFEAASYQSLSYEAPRTGAPAPADDPLSGMELAEPEEEAPAAPPRAPESAPAARAVGGGSVDALFGGATVAQDDEAAASALAGVFSAQDGAAADGTPSGRPTRAAATELSLDHVFRDPSRKAEPRRSTGGFSFDQFFSEAAGGTASATPVPPPGKEGAPDPSTDIEQFNAWLEGLKKK